MIAKAFDDILPPIGAYYTIFMKFFKKRIYLDYASSTPVDTVMMSHFQRLSKDALSANPSALHKEGQAAKKVLEQSRALVAKTVFAHPDEIIFTASATESDNIALQGAVTALLKQGVAKNTIAVMTTDTEHAAVFETVLSFAPQIESIILPTEDGVLDPKLIVIPEHIQMLMVSVLYVNNEIGVVQPIYDIAKRIRFCERIIPQ